MNDLESCPICKQPMVIISEDTSEYQHWECHTKHYDHVKSEGKLVRIWIDTGKYIVDSEEYEDSGLTMTTMIMDSKTNEYLLILDGKMFEYREDIDSKIEMMISFS